MQNRWMLVASSWLILIAPGCERDPDPPRGPRCGQLTIRTIWTGGMAFCPGSGREKKEILDREGRQVLGSVWTWIPSPQEDLLAAEIEGPGDEVVVLETQKGGVVARGRLPPGVDELRGFKWAADRRSLSWSTGTLDVDGRRTQTRFRLTLRGGNLESSRETVPREAGSWHDPFGIPGE